MKRKLLLILLITGLLGGVVFAEEGKNTRDPKKEAFSTSQHGLNNTLVRHHWKRKA